MLKHNLLNFFMCSFSIHFLFVCPLLNPQPLTLQAIAKDGVCGGYQSYRVYCVIVTTQRRRLTRKSRSLTETAEGEQHQDSLLAKMLDVQEEVQEKEEQYQFMSSQEKAYIKPGRRALLSIPGTQVELTEF